MVIRYSSALLSKTSEFVTKLCGVVPINLPATHLNALRIMNSLLFNTFLSSSNNSSSNHGDSSHGGWGNGGGGNIYMSSDSHSFRTRIDWMQKSYVVTASEGDSAIFEQIKKHLLLVEVFASTYAGLNSWRRSLVDLNAAQYWLQQSIVEKTNDTRAALREMMAATSTKIQSVEAQIEIYRDKVATITRNMEQKDNILDNVRDCLHHTKSDLSILEEGLKSFVPQCCIAIATLLRAGSYCINCIHTFP